MSDDDIPDEALELVHCGTEPTPERALSKVYTLKIAPPSLNQAFFNRKGVGRCKSSRYKTWQNAAGWELKAQGVDRVSGKYRLSISIGHSLSRADIDNLIKPIADLLVTVGATDDDRHMRAVYIEKTERPDIEIRVEAA